MNETAGNVYVPLKGVSIYTAAHMAKEYLYQRDFKDGKLVFNDLMVPLSVDSNINDIAIIYNLMHQNRQLKLRN